MEKEIRNVSKFMYERGWRKGHSSPCKKKTPLWLFLREKTVARKWSKIQTNKNWGLSSAPLVWPYIIIFSFLTYTSSVIYIVKTKTYFAPLPPLYTSFLHWKSIFTNIFSKFSKSAKWNFVYRWKFLLFKYFKTKHTEYVIRNELRNNKNTWNQRTRF